MLAVVSGVDFRDIGGRGVFKFFFALQFNDLFLNFIIAVMAFQNGVRFVFDLTDNGFFGRFRHFRAVRILDRLNKIIFDGRLESIFQFCERILFFGFEAHQFGNGLFQIIGDFIDFIPEQILRLTDNGLFGQFDFAVVVKG